MGLENSNEEFEVQRQAHEKMLDSLTESVRWLEGKLRGVALDAAVQKLTDQCEQEFADVFSHEPADRYTVNPQNLAVKILEEYV